MRLLLLGFLVFTLDCFAQEKAIPTAAELFQWYDKLGFEEVSKAKFARIWTGDAVVTDGVRTDQDVSDGFVVEDEGGTFRTVLADLTLGVFKKAGDDPAKSDFCGYRELSLKDEAERLIQALKNPRYFEQQEEDESHYHYYDRLSRHAQVFVVARECARRDLPELGDQLVRALAEHPERDGSNRWHPFPNWLKEDLARALSWRASLALRDPTKSWADIRRIYQLIVDHCPDSYHVEGAQKTIHRITALLEVERTRKSRALDDSEELVWRFHEEQDEEIPDNEWPRSYPFEPRKSNGAMAALSKKGKEAVPTLIAELRDSARPSRSASRSTRYGGYMWTQDTHDLSLRVLNKIAGFNFYHLIGWSTPEERAWARLLGAIDDWWLAMRREEEREWLVDKVRDGGRRGEAVADCLLARYPDHFFDAAVSAIRVSDDPGDPYPRREMIQRFVKLKDKRVAPYFLKELAMSEDLGAKTEIAAALRQLGRREGEEQILADIRKLGRTDLEKLEAASPFPGPGEGLDGPAKLQSDLTTAFTFLLESDASEPFQLLVDKWSGFSFSFRNMCVEQLSRRNIRGDAAESLPAAPAPTHPGRHPRAFPTGDGRYHSTTWRNSYLRRRDGLRAAALRHGRSGFARSLARGIHV